MAIKDNMAPQQNADRVGVAVVSGFSDNSSGAITGLSAGAGDVLINVMYFGTPGTTKNISSGSTSISNNRIVIVTGGSTSNGTVQVHWWKGDSQL